jgi:hypothetical protein
MRGQKRVEDARERAYAPRIHLLRKKVLQRWMGLHRNSGLPELRIFMRRKPGNDGLFARHEWVLHGARADPR